MEEMKTQPGHSRRAAEEADRLHRWLYHRDGALCSPQCDRPVDALRFQLSRAGTHYEVVGGSGIAYEGTDPIVAEDIYTSSAAGEAVQLNVDGRPFWRRPLRGSRTDHLVKSGTEACRDNSLKPVYYFASFLIDGIPPESDGYTYHIGFFLTESGIGVIPHDLHEGVPVAAHAYRYLDEIQSGVSRSARFEVFPAQFLLALSHWGLDAKSYAALASHCAEQLLASLPALQAQVERRDAELAAMAEHLEAREATIREYQRAGATQGDDPEFMSPVKVLGVIERLVQERDERKRERDEALRRLKEAGRG